jgi:hypothetical protein
MKGALLVLALLVATPAAAQSIPHYAVESWCNKVARSGGAKSEMIYGGCIDQEQSAYNELKGAWGALPIRMRAWCDQVAKSGGTGSYMILKGCIDQEQSAASTNSRRTFQR